MLQLINLPMKTKIIILDCVLDCIGHDDPYLEFNSSTEAQTYIELHQDYNINNEERFVIVDEKVVTAEFVYAQ